MPQSTTFLTPCSKREHRAGNALTVGEPAQVVLHDDVHATAGVAALGHAAATQAVGDEHRMLPALCLQQRLDGGRVHVLAVTDDLGVGLGVDMAAPTTPAHGDAARADRYRYA